MLEKWSVPSTAPIKYLTPLFMLGLYERQIRAKWLPYPRRGTPVLSFPSWQSSKVIAQPRGWWMTFHPTTPFPLMKCPDELHFFLPPVLSFPAKSPHATYTGIDHSYSFGKREVSFGQLFPKNCCFWNGATQIPYNINLFRFRVNRYPYKTHLTSLSTTTAKSATKSKRRSWRSKYQYLFLYNTHQLNLDFEIPTQKLFRV